MIDRNRVEESENKFMIYSLSSIGNGDTNVCSITYEEKKDIRYTKLLIKLN